MSELLPGLDLGPPAEAPPGPVGTVGTPEAAPDRGTIGAWAQLWRRIGQDVPTELHEVAKLRQQLRAAGRR